MIILLSIIGSTLFTLLSWKNLPLAIAVLFGTLPVYLIRFSIGPIPTTLLELLFLILFGVWIVKYKGWQKSILLWKKLPSWRMVFLLIGLAATAGVLVSGNLTEALGVWKAYYIEPMLLALIILTSIRNKNEVRGIFVALGISGIAVSVFGLLQFITGLGLPIPWDIERRVTSFFPYPNAVGLYLGPIIIIAALELLRTYKTKIWHLVTFWSFVLLLASATIFLSETEAAWIAIPAALAVVSLFYKKTRRIAILLIVLTAIVVLVTPAAMQKLTLQDYSGSVRLKQWEETYHFLSDNWTLGAGLSGYPSALEPYHTYEEIEIFQYPHNIILNIWVELGIAGVLIFLWLASLIIRGFLNRYGETIKQDWVLLISFTVLLEMGIHGLVDVPYFKNELAMLSWGVIALFILSLNPYGTLGEHES